MSTASLRITEIFYSLQGESNTVGCPTVFVRLTGCPLRCQYCDTTYAFKGGERKALSEVLASVSQYNTPYVTVTGGEPLAQQACIPLLQELCDKGYQVSLETSGAMSVAEVDPRVTVVLDLKTPGSDEVDRNLWDNLAHLKPTDQIKFVICHEADYNWAKTVVAERGLTDICTVWFSPSQNELPAATLADWMLTDQLPVRFQVQLHKVLWGDAPGK